jgi:hypothetical protein
VGFGPGGTAAPAWSADGAEREIYRIDPRSPRADRLLVTLRDVGAA